MIEKVKKNKIIRLILFPLIVIKRVLWSFKNRKTIQFNNLFSNINGGSLIVSIKGIDGKFEIDSRSHILQRIMVDKYYEYNIVKLLTQYIQKDKDAINVGANIGIFTVLIGTLLEENRCVLSVEPTPNAYVLLKKNIERNNLKDKVILFNGICVDEPGEYSLNVIQGKEEYSSIGESVHIAAVGKEACKIKVKGETIDNLIENYKMKPGLLFLDAEGAEMKVLQGAGQILKKYKPVIISELDDRLLEKQGTSAEKIVEYLLKQNYDVFDIEMKSKLKYPFSGNIIAIYRKLG